MRPYIYIEFFKKLLSYYLIDLCQILNRSTQVGTDKIYQFIEIINLSRINL